MRNLKKLLFSFLLFYCYSFSIAVNSVKVDSLTALLSNQSDKRKLSVYLFLIEEFKDSSLTISEQYAEKGITLATKLKDTLALMNFSLESASILADEGKNEEAIKKSISVLELCEIMDDKQQIIKAHLIIGACYVDLEQYELATNYLNKAFNIAQKIRDPKLVAEALNGLGNVYSKGGVGKRTEAANYYMRALSIAEEIDNQELIAKLSNNLANIYLAQGMYSKSMNYYERALRIAKENHDEIDEAFYNNNIGALYLKNNRPEEAEKYQLKALSIAEKGNNVQLQINVYAQLAYTYEKLNKYVKAYNFKSKLYEITRKATTEQASRQIAEMQAKYESMQKENEIIALQMNKKHNESVLENYQKGLFTLAVIILLSIGLLLVLATFLRLRKKNNSLLQEKNILIEKQNLKITDSINYAKRIQSSILPSKQDVAKILPQCFIIYLPKDIVSGDFYWMAKANNKILLAVADCTGHGVPGAFMSMIGNTLLNEIITYQPLLKPSEILSLLNKRISSSLRQKRGEINSQDDGMDISICSIDYDTNKIQFAGANHAIYTVVHGDLNEIRGDVFPVGGVFATNEIVFTDKEIALQAGMMVYMFTDGYKDQFGGTDGQKFKSSRFEKLLSDIYKLPMEEQEEHLYQGFLSWKGNLNQLDDILVIGIRL